MSRRPTLLPMIWVPREDLLRPVELLAEHGADHEMRPGHGTEGKKIIGAFAHRLAVTVGAADEEGDGRSGLPPTCDVVGEIDAGEALAALVEGDRDGAVGQASEEQFALAASTLGCRQLAPLLDLLDVKGPRQAIGVKTLEVEMRPGLGTADGGDQDAQGAFW